MATTEGGPRAGADAGNGTEQSWIARSLRLDPGESAGDTFVAANLQPGQRARLFGGLIAAQALYAAGQTVDPVKHPQSLHLYFVSGGTYDTDVTLHVHRTRSGRSFDTRRVTAVQDDTTILEMIASFHAPEPGADWQPPAETALAFADAVPKRPAIEFADEFEFRCAPGDSSKFALPPYWVRVRDPVGDDPLLCAATLTLLSDLGPVPTVRPTGVDLDRAGVFATSLDHSIWFHRPYRPAEWHRYEVATANRSDSLGLAVGSMYDTAGVLIATVTQEALWRV